MPLTEYLAGIAYLTITFFGLALAAVVIRRRLLPGWHGAVARLAELICGISILVVAAELLGSFGLLSPLALLASVAVIAAACWWLLRAAPSSGGEGDPPVPGPEGWKVWLALAVAVIAVLHWSGGVHDSLDHGIYRQDSTWYHLPFSAAIFQTGDTWGVRFTDPMALTAWFYPQNSELLHALGMLGFGTDFLSVFVNVGWLLVALLAAWCAGRPFGRGPEAAIGAAVVLGSEMMRVQAGNAPNDIAGIALLLATMALLLNARAAAPPGRGWSPGAGAILVAGLAAGLAVGTKITLLAPVAVLTAGLLAVVAPGRRLRLGTVWLAGVGLGGGYWYLRNLAHTGNPLPWIRVGTLPGPDQLALYPRPAHSVADYAFEPDVWLHQFAPDLSTAMGPLWPLVLAAAAAGLLAAVARGADLQRVLGVAGIAAAVAYVFVPVSASGSPGHPSGFESNLRYLAPALVVGLVLLPLQVGGRGRLSRWPAPALAGLFAVAAFASTGWRLDQLGDGTVLALALIAAPVAAVALATAGSGPARLASPLVLAAVLVVVLGFPSQRDYEHHRYDPSLAPPGDNPGFRDSPQWRRIQSWARGVHGARIGLAGPPAAFGQYVFYDPELTNHVQYLGEPGPRGSYRPIESCLAWRRAVNRGHLRFVVVTPAAEIGPGSIPQEDLWTRSDPAAREVIDADPAAVFQINAELDPRTCRSKLLPPTIHVPGGGYAVPGTRR